jgi:hypothetical protein
MTKNGIILNEMLSLCALSFVWGTIQPNLIQRYSNTPVVLEVLAELCRVPLTRVTESLIKEPFFIQQQIKILQQQSEILAQNKQLESIVREQAKEYSRALSNGTRIGILVSLGLAGLSMLDNCYGFSSQILAMA